MIVRVGFVVAASVAAVAVKQLNRKPPKPSKPSENGKGGDTEQAVSPNNNLNDKSLEEEEEEEVKLINSVINQTRESFSDYLDADIENLLSGEIEYPLPSDDNSLEKAEKERRYESEMAYNDSELERLRQLVKELEEREVKLEGELLEYYGLKEQESDIVELQRQLKIKTVEIDMLNITINSLQAERKKLQEEISQNGVVRKELEAARNKIKELQRQIQLDANQTKGQLLLLKQHVSSLQMKEEEAMNKDSEVERKLKAVQEMEVEVMELKRKNRELQHEKRELTIKLDSAEARISALSNMTELDKTDLNLLMLVWKQKLDLVLFWSFSLRGQGDTDVESNFSQPSSPGSDDFDNASMDSSTSRFSSFSKKPGLIQKLKRWGGKSKDDSSVQSSPSRSFYGGSPGRLSVSMNKQRGPLESLMIRNAGESVAITTFGKVDQETSSPGEPLNNVAASFQVMSKSVDNVLDEKYPAYKDRHKLAVEREKHIKHKADQARAERFGGNVALPPKLAQLKEKPVSVPSLTRTVTASDQSSDGNNEGKASENAQAVAKMKLVDIEKRPPRVPRPPPRSAGGGKSTNVPSPRPPLPGGGPPPPPPPPGGGGALGRGAGSGSKVHRAPELVEFYQSLMKREAKKDGSPSLISPGTGSSSEARSNMIGEIENRSTFLLAVKADVETQGDFVQSLATEVRAASFTDVEDLLAFVSWLDEELSFLVDERAVLKHFDWPEGKADALREAAFEYQDLMKLEKQVTSFVDDPNLPCEPALKKMYKLLEKVEQSVYALLRTRDMAVSRYKEFGIPVDWLSDSGVVGKVFSLFFLYLLLHNTCLSLEKCYVSFVTQLLFTLSTPPPAGVSRRRLAPVGKRI
ncbi:BnaA06g33450D [Brassica napus]|uniref:BnaA06g33450D protein n=1 Tax=Brassica napus TaxID=3708 RepID=A0A078FMM3_BRANA|nr:BnaA06g33450D [Brassica napus]